MAKNEAGAAPADDTHDNGSEAEQLAAAAAGMAAEGKLGSDPANVPEDLDAKALERARRQRDPEAYKEELRERHDLVTCTVTEEGDGKISRGRHFGGIGEDHYEEGETFQAERRNALELKKRHLVQIAQ